jgi:type II secretory pathway pseudopilin PulG
MIFLRNMPTGWRLNVRKKAYKRPLVLIEVLIAIALLALLSTFLFMSLRQIAAWSHLNESEFQNEELISNAHQTLARVFSQAVIEDEQNDPETSQEDQRFFFTGNSSQGAENSNSLVFTFNNGVDRDPRFSNVVLAKIYLDHYHRLCLAVRPLPSRWKNVSADQARQEVLLEDISSLGFIFYQPPQDTHLDVRPKEVQTGKVQKQPLPGEQNTWLQDYKQLPSLVKIVAIPDETEKKPIVFSYLLPSSRKTIFFKSEKVVGR